jgi:hypothetical protein
MKTLKVLIISFMLASTFSVSARDLGNKSGAQKSFFASTGFMVAASVVLGVGFGIGGHEAYKRYWKKADSGAAGQTNPSPVNNPKKSAKRSLGQVAAATS